MIILPPEVSTAKFMNKQPKQSESESAFNVSGLKLNWTVYTLARAKTLSPSGVQVQQRFKQGQTVRQQAGIDVLNPDFSTKPRDSPFWSNYFLKPSCI